MHDKLTMWHLSKLHPGRILASICLQNIARRFHFLIKNLAGRSSAMLLEVEFDGEHLVSAKVDAGETRRVRAGGLRSG